MYWYRYTRLIFNPFLDLGASAAEFESRPKRKSGSLPELGLGSLPPKKQRPEEEDEEEEEEEGEGTSSSGKHVLHPMETPAEENSSSSYLCGGDHTAPTSPASPEPLVAAVTSAAACSTQFASTLSPRHGLTVFLFYFFHVADWIPVHFISWFDCRFDTVTASL